MATTINSGYADSPKLTANIADHADVYGGRALVFDGVSDYLDCGDITSLNSASAFSISVWIKSDNTNSLDYLYNKTSSSSNLIRMAIAYNIMYFNVYNGGNAYGSVAFTSTDWNHISLVFNGSGTGNSNRLKAYINGEEQSLTYTGTIPSATGNLSGTAFQIGKYLTDHFEGSMCDFKIFDSALTEAQVQELYKKPENTPSAVQDNLVAWYPMIEGNPESPQSIVYDHSETKLGTDVVKSPLLLDYAHTQGGNTEELLADGTIKISRPLSGGDPYGTWFYFLTTSNHFLETTPLVGQVYKLSFNGYYDGGGSQPYWYLYGQSSGDISFPITTTPTDYVAYFIGSGLTGRFQLNTPTAGQSGYIKDLQIKPVLMGNHATTNFFGDDLTNGHGAFDVTTNWSVVGGSLGTEWSIGSSKATHATGNTRSLRYENLSNPTIGGRKYQVDFTISGRTAGNLDFAVGSGPASASDFTASGSVILTSGGSASRIVDIITSSDFDGSVELITVKEVGISSSGFETAVNEPVVPQVPLMRYNQKMYFDGVDDYVSLGGDVSLANDFTIEILASTFKSGGNDFLGHASDNTFIRTDTANNRLRIRNTSGSIANLTSFTIPTDGSVFHLVLSRNSGSITAYLNGVKTGNTPTLYGALNINEIGNVSGNTEYDGLIFSVSIFNSAFTETEAQELFNDGVALDATTHSKANDYLLGYWRNDGVTTWTDRSDIQAIGFDGSDDNIDFGNDSSLQPASELTVSAWAYMNNWSSASQSRIISNTQSGGYAIALDEVNDNNISFFVNNGAYLNPNYALSNLSSGWHHVCATYKNKTAKLYIDGSLVDTDTNTNNTNITYNSNVKLFAGAEPDASNNTSIFFNGLLGQIAVFNRELISSEISAIYALGRRTDLTTSYSTNLQGYWFLNPTHSNPDLTGADKILDRSGNGNHGTQSGGVNFLGANDGTVQGTPDSITIREGLNSNRDGLGFYFKNADSNTLRLNRKLEHLVIPYTKSLSATSMSDAITVECWVKFHNHPTGYNVIAGNASGGSWSNGWALAMVDNGLRFTINNYNSPKATFQITDFTKWYHIVGIYDRSLSSNNVALYVDLVRGTSAHYTTPIGESNQGIHIGYLHGEGAGVKASTCLIDELRIYNRVLTAFEADGSTPEDGETAISGEIVKNYKHGKGKHKND